MSLLALLARAAAAGAATAATGASSVAVDKLVDQLSAADPADRARASILVQDLPPSDLPQLEAAAARGDLPPEADVRLKRVLPSMRQRVRVAERTRRRDAVMAAFQETESVAEFDHGSHRDPKWDDAARAFLHAAAARRTVGLDGGVANRDALAKFEAAVAAGCDDPAVLTWGGLVLNDTRQPARRVRDTFVRAGQAAADGRAGPLCRTIMDGRLIRPAEQLPAAARARVRPAYLKRLADMADAFHGLLGVGGLPASTAADTAENLFDREVGLGVPLAPFFTEVMAPLEKSYPNDPAVLTLKGRAYVKWAWEARGSGWANTVTPQGWKDFADRLALANATLTQAWSLDHEQVDAANRLLIVGLGQGWTRAAMDIWYQRAVAADPDDSTAAEQMMLYLEPKWQGSPEAMIRFGRDCLEAGNFRSDSPQVLASAHDRLAKNYVRDPNYWLRSGVWDDVSAVYLGYLTRLPDHAAFHNQLARYAVLCHQWKAADAQFKWLGDKADATLFGNGSDAALNEARRTAAKLADQPEEQGR